MAASMAVTHSLAPLSPRHKLRWARRLTNKLIKKMQSYLLKCIEVATRGRWINFGYFGRNCFQLSTAFSLIRANFLHSPQLFSDEHVTHFFPYHCFVLLYTTKHGENLIDCGKLSHLTFKQAIIAEKLRVFHFRGRKLMQFQSRLFTTEKPTVELSDIVYCWVDLSKSLFKCSVKQGCVCTKHNNYFEFNISIAIAIYYRTILCCLCNCNCCNCDKLCHSISR